MSRRFGPASRRYAAVAWLRSKKKGSRRPEDQRRDGERVETPDRSAPRSQTRCSRSWGLPPRGAGTGSALRMPVGFSAQRRLDHVSAGTIALKGTPATAAFQTSAPPSSHPSAPICVSETSGRAASQSKIACASSASLGPARSNEPPDDPVPRSAHETDAKPAAAKPFRRWAQRRARGRGRVLASHRRAGFRREGRTCTRAVRRRRR